MEGCFHLRFDKLVPADVLKYCRTQASKGSRTRYEGDRARVRGKPHASAKEYQKEFMSKVWEDAGLGRVLLTTVDHRAIGVWRIKIGRGRLQLRREGPEAQR